MVHKDFGSVWLISLCIETNPKSPKMTIPVVIFSSLASQSPTLYNLLVLSIINRAYLSPYLVNLNQGFAFYDLSVVSQNTFKQLARLPRANKVCQSILSSTSADHFEGCNALHKLFIKPVPESLLLAVN